MGRNVLHSFKNKEKKKKPNQTKPSEMEQQSIFMQGSNFLKY